MDRDRGYKRAGATSICVTGLRGIPGVMGGVESHCEQLFPRLKARFGRYDFTLIARRPYVSTDPYDYRGVTIVPLAALPSKYLEAISNTLFAVLYARFFLRSQLLHIHAIGPSLCGPLARLLGMKLIVTHHSNNYEHSKWNRFAKMALKVGAWCAVRSSNKVIVVSKSLAQELGRRFPAQKHKIEYIPNGATDLSAQIDKALSDIDLLSKYNLEQHKYIVAVGRLVPEKGFHDLLAAFNGIATDLKLVIVGKADHQDAYAKNLLSQASDRVVFTGFQDHSVLRILYANASLFVLPSYQEGLPIAALEAGVMGLPLVLSDIGPNRDLGLPPDNYFPAGDVAALGRKLLDDHSTFRVDRDALAKGFNWDAIAEATAKVYASVLVDLTPAASFGFFRSFSLRSRRITDVIEARRHK